MSELVGLNGSSCKCRKLSPTRMVDQIKWPSVLGTAPTDADGWVLLPKNAHSVGYARGPVPWVEVRPRGDVLARVDVYLGDTLDLDCSQEYEIRAATSSTDLLRFALTAPIFLQRACVVYVDYAGRLPGVLNLCGRTNVLFGDAAVEMLSVPWLGSMVGVLYLQSQNFSVANAQAEVIGDPCTSEFLESSTAFSMSPAAFTGGTQSRVIFIGEDGRFGTPSYLATLQRMPGYFERLRMRLDGSGASGFIDVAWALHGRRHDR